MTSLRIRAGAVRRYNDSILLVEHEKDNRRYWLPPGGEVGEKADDALAREVCEETPVRVDVGRLLCICDSISPDHTRHIVHLLYETRRIAGAPESLRDPRVRGAAFAPVDSLENLTIYPPIQTWLVRRLSTGFLDVPEYLGDMRA